MSHKERIIVTEQKVSAERKLAARLELLKSKGVDEPGAQKDSFIKKLQADIRKTKRQLLSISAQEKLTAQRAQEKIDKLAAKKNADKQPAAKPAAPAAEQKPKKEKKKKEKKA
jgi:hypothetical protein